MSNLRDKYKSTSTAKLKNRIQEEDALVGSSDRAGFHTIEEGLNKFRIYPAHDPENGNFYELILKHWMTLENDQGKEVRATVNNAKHHGGLKKDPFEEYIRMVPKFLDDNEDDNAASKVALLTDWKTGLSASPGWILYADKLVKDKEPKFAILEFNKSTRDGLNKIAVFEEEDAAIQSEPFTDPDDGIPVMINYKPKEKKAGDKYSVTIGTKPKALPLTDEQLEYFESQKPLNQIHKGYSIDDLTKALEGIRFFDEKHEINMYDSDEWQEVIEELTTMVKAGKKSSKDDKTKKSTPPPAVKAAAKKPVKKEEEEEEEAEEEEEEEVEEVKPPAKKSKGDQFTTMDRDELKEFWAENDLAETGLKLMKSDTDDQVRVKVREAVAIKMASSEEEEVEEEEEEEAPPAKKSTPVVTKKPAKKEEPEEEEEEDDADDSKISLDKIKEKIRKSKG